MEAESESAPIAAKLANCLIERFMILSTTRLKGKTFSLQTGRYLRRRHARSRTGSLAMA